MHVKNKHTQQHNAQRTTGPRPQSAPMLGLEFERETEPVRVVRIVSRMFDMR